MYKYLANTLFTGKNLIYLPSCHSTNEIARQAIQNNQGPEGTIVITDHQTAGKGQRGNTWEADAGENLTFSVIYRPNFLSAADTFWLTVITSLALIQSLKSFGINSSIKWPNDIFHGNLKLAGILIENLMDNKNINYSIIGIGLNLNQKFFKTKGAVSLYNITGRHYDPATVLNAVATNLEQQYIMLKNGRYEVLKKLYLNYLLGLEELRAFEKENGHKIEGRIKGVDEGGRLKLEIAGNIDYFSFKEIKFLFKS